MCLGIPGQIVAVSDPARKLVLVDVCGVQREVNVAPILSSVPGKGALDDLLGVWTLVHVGFAMSRINEEEAEKTMAILRAMGETQQELDAMMASQAMLSGEGAR